MKLYKNKKSNIHRHGLSAAINIKKNKKIIQYKGKKITLNKTETDPKYDNEKEIYLFTFARFINHSCNPNCEVLEDNKQLWIFAMRDIKKNEELTYDYGFSFDKDYKQYVCKCGSKKCVGYIVREGSRWRIKKASSTLI